MKRLTEKQIDARLAKLTWEAHAWGELERLAGITDRNQFWTGKDKAVARAECRALIRERIAKGELA